jgi:hypothetical protein
MLGITTPDAIAFGMLVLAGLAIDRHADAIHHSVEANQKRRDDKIAQQLTDLVSKLDRRS